MPNRPPPSEGPTSASRQPGDGLVIDPFRGWSFDPARVQVDDAVCPPYDVVEPDDDEAGLPLGQDAPDLGDLVPVA